MNRRDDSVPTLQAVASTDDDPLPGPDERWDRDADRDTTLDAATIARVRDAARHSRPRVARRLADAGFLPSTDAPHPYDDGPRDLDWRRDLDGRLDEDVAFIEHIDELHDQRLRSLSARERQAATRTLAQALYRIVDGYWVDDGPPHRPVQFVRRLDGVVARGYARLAAVRTRRGPLARLWWRYERWSRLGLAIAGGAALAGGLLVWGAAAVVLRTMLSAVFVVSAPAENPRRRLLGYNTQWASCVATHVGDAAILAGLGAELVRGGQPAAGAVTAVAALFGLTATMTRVAASSEGFRLPRMFLDRLTKAIALPAAAVLAAVVAGTGRGGFGVGGVGGGGVGDGGLGDAAGVLPALVAVVGVTAVALTDLVRVVYWTVRRRRLFRRVGAAGGGLVPDVIVARTNDALVMNITRAQPRTTVFDDGEGAVRHLRAVGETRSARR